VVVLLIAFAAAVWGDGAAAHVSLDGATQTFRPAADKEFGRRKIWGQLPVHGGSNR